MNKISIIPTEVSNSYSVQRFFERLNYQVSFSSSDTEIANARLVLLPGVGSFSAGITYLRDRKIDDAIKLRIKNKRPTMAICLGMQLLFNSSQESLSEIGLTIFNESINKFSNHVKIPHFGWNKVEFNNKNIPSGYAYFANSYCLKSFSAKDYELGVTNYDEIFISTLFSDFLLATQFHPELSAEFGVELFKYWEKIIK
jgi:glutamine amidotransferase